MSNGIDDVIRQIIDENNLPDRVSNRLLAGLVLEGLNEQRRLRRLFESLEKRVEANERARNAGRVFVLRTSQIAVAVAIGVITAFVLRLLGL